MVIELILIIAGLLALLAASISDIKTREVPDWVSYSLIISGFGLRLFHSLTTSEWFFLLHGVIGFLIMMILGNLMFRTRQWGGGDTKLLMGIGVAFATTPSYLPSSAIPFLAIVLINILLIGAIYGISYGVILAVKHRDKFLPAFKYLNQEKKVARIKMMALAIAILIIIFLFATNLDTRAKLLLGILALMGLLYPYLSLFIKAVEKSCLYKRIPVTKLTPGDWVEENVYKNNKLIYKRKPLGIEQEDIQKVIKAKVKDVLVKEGIPFIPPFFIGTLISVITGEIIGII